MSKKQRFIFGGSLVFNVLLIIFLVIGYLKMNLVHEELFYSEVQYKLVELDGLIEAQKNEGWSEPNVVTTQLGDVLDGIDVAVGSGKYSGWLSTNEKSTMERLDNALRQYPHDVLYKFSVVTQQDKESFEVLQSHLQKVGFGMNMTISNDWETFIGNSENLLELLQQ